MRERGREERRRGEKARAKKRDPTSDDEHKHKHHGHGHGHGRFAAATDLNRMISNATAGGEYANKVQAYSL